MQGSLDFMVCSLRSSGSGRNEIVCLEANPLKLVPKMLFLRDISISGEGDVNFGAESKFCSSCRGKLDSKDVQMNDLTDLCKILCEPCSEVLLEYAKSTLSASKSLLKCKPPLATLPDSSTEPVKKRIRIIQRENLSPELQNQLPNIQESCHQLESPSSKDTKEPSDEPASFPGILVTDGKSKELFSDCPATPKSDLAVLKTQESPLFSKNASIVVLLEGGKDGKSEYTPARYETSKIPSIFQKFEEANTDWCRYCGTTNGVNWRPGPWGKKTLCNRHGCDYKGYGFAAHKPKLDLSAFYTEDISERKVPVLKEYCMGCLSNVSTQTNPIIMCHGCPKSYHIPCYKQENECCLHGTSYEEGKAWFCSPDCRVNIDVLSIVIDLPKRGLPFSIPSNKNSHKISTQKSSTRSTCIRKPRPLSSSLYSLSSLRRSKEGLDSFVYDSDLIAKINHRPLVSSVIEIPTWSYYDISLSSSYSPVESNLLETEENTTDEAFIERHMSFESLEKTSRLLFGLKENNQTN